MDVRAHLARGDRKKVVEEGFNAAFAATLEDKELPGDRIDDRGALDRCLEDAFGAEPGDVGGLRQIAFAIAPEQTVIDRRLGDQPWGTVLPVIAIALLTIGTGLIGDGLSRAAAGIDRARGGDT